MGLITKMHSILASLAMVSAVAVAQEEESASPRWVDLVELQLEGLSSSLSEVTLDLTKIPDYVGERLGATVPVVPLRITVQFLPPEADPSRASDPNRCPLRGLSMSSTSSHTIMIFINDETSRDQLLGVFAHEVAHIVQWIGMEGGRSIDGMINEGLPTWAAGDYWLRLQGVSSWDAAVDRIIERDSYIPLSQIEQGTGSSRVAAEDCIARRDTVYTEWAAFIDYLVKTYGKEQLDGLFQGSGNENVRVPIDLPISLTPRLPPDFSRIYGKPLEELEAEWLSAILEHFP